jgi:hypothetical protein
LQSRHVVVEAAPSTERGRSSGVEHNLAKVGVEGSNPFARSIVSRKVHGRHRVGPQTFPAMEFVH